MVTERLRVLPDVCWRVLPGEVLALGPVSDEVTSIRGAGTALWGSLLDGACPETLERDAVRAGCPPDQARDVVDQMVRALTDAGLIGPGP